jgi:hypothetical protein
MASYVEARGCTWNSAAEAIVRELKSLSLAPGEIISIDAHNNGPNDFAIFSAFYKSSRSCSPGVSVDYLAQNSADSWTTQYSKAAQQVDELLQHQSSRIISITSSCNENGTGVTFVFYEKL